MRGMRLRGTLTLWGLGLEILPVPGTEHFLGTFFIFLLNNLLFVMVANSPHYSPYFKSTCPSDNNVIFYFYTKFMML